MEKPAMTMMKTGVLFSGGKDSCLALGYAMKHTEVACLIHIESENPESYMFHTPNAELTQRQSEAIDIPIITRKTEGIEEKELEDLEQAIRTAMEIYKIEGIVTGAIDSAYQSSRIQRICDTLGLNCFNPLWQKDQMELLEELIHNRFEAIIVGIFGEGLDGMLGKKIDSEFLSLASGLKKKHINPAGEGGEMESFVLDAPFFKKKLEIRETHIIEDSHGGKILSINGLSSTKKSANSIGKMHVPVISDNTAHDVIIINLNTYPLHDYEFIKPIADIIEGLGKKVRTIHYKEGSQETLKHSHKIILAGTSLMNMEYIGHAEKLSYIKELNKPILGICAGMQLIGLMYKSILGSMPEIGLKDAEFHQFLGLEGPATIYALHKNVIMPTEEFLEEFDILGKTFSGGKEIIHAIKHKHKPIYGTLFHPEARNKHVIETFLY